MITSIVFYVASSMILASAMVVVLSKNIVKAAFSLFFTFLGFAVVYILLKADFLALVQVLIYMGGILVLILFGVMLTQRVEKSSEMEIKPLSFIPALTLSLSILTILLLMIFKTNWISAPVTSFPDTTIVGIGNLFLGQYLLAFEIISILLLAALIGAMYIARRG